MAFSQVDYRNSSETIIQHSGAQPLQKIFEYFFPKGQKSILLNIIWKEFSGRCFLDSPWKKGCSALSPEYIAL